MAILVKKQIAVLVERWSVCNWGERHCRVLAKHADRRVGYAAPDQGESANSNSESD